MMTIRLMIAAGALLATTSALAQAQVEAELTPDDLVCQLSDACVEVVEDVPAEESDDASAQPAPVPGGRVSATRGFKIADKVSVPAATKRPAANPARPAAAKVTPVKRKVVVTPGKSISAKSAVKVPSAGRADLRVSFVTGSAELTDAGKRSAQTFVEALKSPALGGMRFRIEGHTDAVGGRDYNLLLSKARAQSVVDYLSGRGADRSRFDVVGYGFDKPLPGTSAMSADNRRVEVVRIK